MKILTFGPATSSHILTRAKAFMGAGHETTIISEYNTIDNEVDIICPFSDLSVYSPWTRPLIFLMNVSEVIKILRNEQYDICHTHYSMNILSWVVAVFSRKPVVAIAMGGDVLFEQHKTLPWYQKKLSIYALRNADMVVCKSPYLKERVMRLGVEKNKIQTCIFGVSDLFLTDLNEKSKKPFIFISARPVNEFYNFEKVIDVIAALNQMGVESHLKILLLAPNEGYLEKLRMRVVHLKLLEKVEFLRSLRTPDDLIDLYRTSHFVIALPESDGIPQSALEGMAQGCINVIPQNETYKGVFNEENSILVSGNAESIAKIIIAQIGNMDSIRIQSRQFVLQHASLTQNVKKIAESFDSIKFNPNFKIRFKMTLVMIIYFMDQFFIMGLRNKMMGK